MGRCKKKVYKKEVYTGSTSAKLIWLTIFEMLMLDLECTLLTDIKKLNLPIDQIDFKGICTKNQLTYGKPGSKLHRTAQLRINKLKPKKY